VLGKPCTIEFEDGSTRENYYLSDGTKISYLLDDSLESTLHYRGSMVYKSEWDEIEDIVSERLESVAHPEGRFFASSYTSSGQPVLKNWHYVTDQVGSIVAVVDMDMMAAEDEDAAVERSEYYAYGRRVGHPAFPKVSGNRHRFNGKEEITDDASPYIDYGARTYSPALRGWLSPDPLADKYFDLSPYAFCADDPVNVVDPDGKEGIKTVDANGNVVITSNVVVLLKDKREIQENSSLKQRTRINKANERLEKRNIERLNTIKDYLTSEFPTSKASDGTSVSFVFNIIPEYVSNPAMITTKDARPLSLKNGIPVETPDRIEGSFGSGIALSAVIGQGGSGAALGQTTGGFFVTTNDFSPRTIAHEIGHTLGLDDNWPNSNGGLMDYPAGPLSTDDIDRIILKAYAK